jgi:putative ABC transport system permease protein
VLGLAARNLSARKLRALSTSLAVFFGVAMIAGTLMLTDSVNRQFDTIFADVNAGIDVTVRPLVEVEGEFGFAPANGVDDSLIDEARAVDGVAQVQGSIGDDTAITILDDEGERVGPSQGGPPHIAASVLEEPFEALVPVEGERPRADDQVAIDTETADDQDWAVGDRITITGPAGAKHYTISAISRFGSEGSLGGASIAQFTLPEAQRLTDKQGRVDEIEIAAEEGTTPEELARRVAAALPENVEVRTGAQTAEEDADDIQEGFGFLQTALLVFAGVAVFVGAFLIFNTFSITVAQRVREFAMLRTLGASSRQVLAAVLLEAALVGLLASLLGIVGGFGFVELVKALFRALGFDLPTAGLRIEPGTVVIAVAVGVGATLISALSPALRATRVAPLEALRESAGALTDEARRAGRRRTIVATALIAVGVALLASGLLVASGVGPALSQLGGGLLLLFIGIAMLGDRFVPPLASALGWPIERLRGVTGRLARENSQRQPGRTATTAGALMIGVALVVFVGVFAASLRASINDTIDRQFAGDVTIVNTDGFSPIPAAVADEVAAVDGVGVVSPLTGVPIRLDGGLEFDLDAFEPATLADVANLEWAEGSDSLLDNLGPTGALAEEGWAEDHDFGVGHMLGVTGPGGERIEVTIEGVVSDQSGLIVDRLAIPRDTMRRELGARDDFMTLVGFEETADPEGTRERIDALLVERFPNTEARNQEELKEDQAASIDALVALIYALLGLSVIVSIFGVVNTLSLTIFERTRELGMLRAIGTSRRQVRRMVRYESIVTALLGAVVGAVIGLGLAVAAVQALADEGLDLSVPTSLPILVLIAAIVIGIVAAIGPARRASRVNVIEALQYE